jgi:hypothetical protein
MSAPSTPPPLKPSLEPEQVDRIWARVRAPAPPRSSRPLWLALATATAAAGLTWWLVPRAPPPALLPVGALVADAQVLPDGSHLEPAPGARVEVLRSSGTELATLQRQGRCRYAITEGGPRRWVVETALGTVEVLGTVFTVDVSEQRLEVSVERGLVYVHGSGQAVMLRAGESTRLQPPAPPLPPTPVLTPAPEAPTPEPTPRPAPRPPAPRFSASEVLKAAALEGGAAGRSRLGRWLTESLPGPDWAIVALQLGTLQLDEGHAPAEALRWFDAVIAVGAPPSALEDASARRVEALRALGREDDARAAAAAFSTRWPHSVWRP